MAEYWIKDTADVKTLRQPTIGKWYVEMLENDFNPDNYREGVLAEYCDDGEFYADASDPECLPTDMRDADYLQEQL